MTKTENLNLNQWDPTDPIRREDFNADNAAIDAALVGCGNCRVVTGSYVGTGEYGSANPNTIPYEKKPLFIMMNVGQYNSYNDIPKVFIWYRDVTQACSYQDNAPLSLTWNEDHVSWYFGSNNYQAINQFNESGTTYHYIIFYA